MGRLIAIEGRDGAGKRTCAEALLRRLTKQSYSAEIISFPLYEKTLGGKTIGDFLASRVPSPANPKVIAVFYAVDRFEALPDLLEKIRTNDFVIADRYIGSNAAYQAAKIGDDSSMDCASWVMKLETETFKLPSPALNIYLDTPLETSRELVSRKAKRSYTNMAYDRHEADALLQERVRETYLAIARSEAIGPWQIVRTVDDSGLRTPDAIIDEIWPAVTSAI